MIQNILIIESIDKKKLEKTIFNSNFILDYINHINPESYNLDFPNKRNLDIKYPINFDYIDKPIILGINMFIPKLKIFQKWNVINNDIIIDIKINMNETNIGFINIIINYYINFNNTINLIIKADWIKKSFFVPNGILNHVVDETKKIIILLLNNNKL